VALSQLVFVLSRSTGRAWVGKLSAAGGVLCAAVLWHVFNGLARLAHWDEPLDEFRWAEVYHELVPDVFAVGWALATSLMLGIPCNYGRSTSGASGTTARTAFFVVAAALATPFAVAPLETAIRYPTRFYFHRFLLLLGWGFLSATYWILSYYAQTHAGQPLWCCYFMVSQPADRATNHSNQALAWPRVVVTFYAFCAHTLFTASCVVWCIIHPHITGITAPWVSIAPVVLGILTAFVPSAVFARMLSRARHSD
jgi:hypothetical protein